MMNKESLERITFTEILGALKINCSTLLNNMTDIMV